MPNASFVGQQDTFLNVKTEKELIHSIKECLDRYSIVELFL